MFKADDRVREPPGVPPAQACLPDVLRQAFKHGRGHDARQAGGQRFQHLVLGSPGKP